MSWGGVHSTDTPVYRVLPSPLRFKLLSFKHKVGSTMVEPGAPHSEVSLPSVARSRCQPHAVLQASCTRSARGLSPAMSVHATH
jgi:hypothetical protein